MSGFTLTAESDELARIFTNALAFFPARGVVKTARLRVWGGSIESTGTDTYTIGRDWCEVRDFQTSVTRLHDEWPIVIELDREGWSDLEKQMRKDKGKAGRLEYLPGDALVFVPGGQEAERAAARDLTGLETTHLVDGESLESRDVWSMCDELLEKLEQREPETPDFIAMDPSLLVRFNKVRTPKAWDGQAVLDIAYQGYKEPLLVKVGPSFLGAIMPIDRKVYAEKQPQTQDALW